MNTAKKLISLICLLLFSCIQFLAAQNIEQTVRGTILDKDTKTPLIGATILVKDSNPALGTDTDENGSFKIANVPVGRISLEISYVGYEPTQLSNLLLSSGKEMVLEIELVESTTELDVVVITSKLDKTKAINELSTVSARSFSVEETSRYAAGNFDPARMAQNFAGVTVGGATDDIFNEIVIRGNSPSGVLWRLEGIQIPNPNHFGDLGSSGGAISMLSSSTLSNSDFYTGAFPSEFGNALSGVFDLNLRTGNNEKREYSLMAGALGLEGSAEGYFSRKSPASYLVNYRYSTLAALDLIGLNPAGDVLPKYQDLSFKINLPTSNAGVFALFGLGGSNSASFEPEADISKWESADDSEGFIEKARMATLGLSHRILLGENAYLRTVVIGAIEDNTQEQYKLNALDAYKKVVNEEIYLKTNTYRISSTYNQKFDAANTIRLGGIVSSSSFNFEYSELDKAENVFKQYFNNAGGAEFIQAFAHWKHRFNEHWTLNTGLHYSQLLFNNKFAIEPRAAVKWQFSKKQSLSASLGLHSKLEHIALYVFEGVAPDGEIIEPAKDLGLTKAAHAVLAYDHVFNSNLRLKTELYYQHLYEVPVTDNPNGQISILNETSLWSVNSADRLVNEGLGRNYGLDITFEKFYSDQYYFLFTGSVFDSKFTPKNGIEYNTRFNANYQFSLLAGKEFKIGRQKNSIFSVNGKVVTSGGNRFTPIDFEASQARGEQVEFKDRLYESRGGQYYRFDLGLSYKINKTKMTHTIMIDIQNLTNHQNVFGLYYDEDSNTLEEYYQTGLFPTFNYRVDF